ncbi:hypothetical protein STANM309S_05885 [Streptomyces tanashiensis]
MPQGVRIDLSRTPSFPLAIGPKNLLDWRYGIHDAVMSAKFGYQVDPAQQARYERALREANAWPRLSDDAQLVLGGTDVPAEVRQKAGPEAAGASTRGGGSPRAAASARPAGPWAVQHRSPLRWCSG